LFVDAMFHSKDIHCHVPELQKSGQKFLGDLLIDTTSDLLAIFWLRSHGWYFIYANEIK